MEIPTKRGRSHSDAGPQNRIVVGSPDDKQTFYHHFGTDHLDPGTTVPEGEKEEVDYSKIKYSALVEDTYDDLPTYPERPHFKKEHLKMKPSTQVIVFDGCPNDPYHPSSMPIYQTATFVQPSATEFGPYDYTRSGNPTRTALETLVAGLESAYASFAFTSGMSALNAVTRLLRAGDEILVCSDLYGGMYRLLTKISEKHGIVVTFVDTTNLQKVFEAIKPNTKLLHMETPSNPLMRICDIRNIAKMLHSKNVWLSVDSTMMTPLLQRPLELGADICVHSGTKFLAGHSDTTMGIVSVVSEDLAKEIAFHQNAEGVALAPFECWLVLRGMKTLSLRVERAQMNAEKVAKYLSTHPKVTDLHYSNITPSKPQLWHTPDRELSVAEEEFRIHQRQSKGGSCVLSFTTGDVGLSQRFVDNLHLFKITVSFGSTNSLVELPCLLSHASIPAHARTLPEDLVRMSLGIEDVDDILNDIKQAFDKASVVG